MDSLSVEENIILPMIIGNIEMHNMHELARKYAEQFQISHILKKNPYELSGGEKQRIALARAMVGKPQVYLLDEITSSLDEQNAREMEEILLAEDAMVLYVCHKIIPELKGQYEMLTF